MLETVLVICAVAIAAAGIWSIYESIKIHLDLR